MRVVRKLTYLATVRGGRLWFASKHSKRMAAELKQYEGKPVELSLCEQVVYPSKQHKGRYYAVTLPLVQWVLINLAGWEPHDIPIKELDSYLRKRFALKEWVEDGHIKQRPQDISEMTNTELLDFTRAIEQWLTEFFEIDVPEAVESCEFKSFNKDRRDGVGRPL